MEEESVGCGELALVATGTILAPLHQPPPLVTAAEARLSQAIRDGFDPGGRFNRGRRPWLDPADLGGRA